MISMLDKTWDIYLAALLHDIGKLGQRAFKSNEGLSEQSLRMREQLCPVSRECYHTHLHVLYTNEFFNLIEKKLPACFDSASVIDISASHHKPNTQEGKLIQKADKLASTVERTGESVNSTRFRSTRLVPITSVIKLLNQKNDSIVSQLGHKLESFTNNAESLMPFEHDRSELTDKYRVLWDGLKIKWEENINSDAWHYLIQAQTDLAEFTWSVPSATNVEIADVSLFDHSRTVSAVAGCLYRTENEEKPFLLISGDYGGIQRYLFDFKRKEADEEESGFARRLRARSFKVRLFTEHLALYLLKSTDSPLVHRLLTAGGKLYLLFPNNSEILENLEKTSNQLDNWSINYSNGELHFYLSWLPLTVDELKTFPKQLLLINEKLGQEATRPLQRIFHSPGWSENVFLHPPVNPDDTKHAEKRDKEFGAKLPKSGGVALTPLEEPQLESDFPFARIKLLDVNEPTHHSELTYSWSLQNEKAFKCLIRSHLALHTPTKESSGDLLTFEELADCSKGRAVLGFIKADVDNLGLIFGQGLGKRASASHIAALSRSLEGFFGDYVNYLIRTRFPLIYLVYSGGDDLAAVGPWDQALDFVITLREEFDRYVGNNPSWGLSAGVLIASPKMHILDAMDQADDLLDQAKGVEGKDRLSFWGNTLPWSQARKSLKLGKQLMDWIQNDDLKTNQVRRLLYYSNLQEQYRKTNDTGYLRYITLLKYDLMRNWKTDTDQARWAQGLLNPTNEVHIYLKQSLNYALYAVRGKEKEILNG
jgi:CRISPR-associated protein Csm1